MDKDELIKKVLKELFYFAGKKKSALVDTLDNLWDTAHIQGYDEGYEAGYDMGQEDKW